LRRHSDRLGAHRELSVRGRPDRLRARLTAGGSGHRTNEIRHAHGFPERPGSRLAFGVVRIWGNSRYLDGTRRRTRPRCRCKVPPFERVSTNLGFCDLSLSTLAKLHSKLAH
jgi:hypothetical protein